MPLQLLLSEIVEHTTAFDEVDDVDDVEGVEVACGTSPLLSVGKARANSMGKAAAPAGKATLPKLNSSIPAKMRSLIRFMYLSYLTYHERYDTERRADQQ